MKRKITSISTSSSQQMEESMEKESKYTLESLNKKMKQYLESDNKVVIIPETIVDETVQMMDQSTTTTSSMEDNIGSTITGNSDDSQISIGSIGSILLEDENYISIKEELPFSSTDFNNEEEYDHLNTIPVVDVKLNVIDNAMDFYGLPHTCAELFKEIKGVHKLYDWQEQLLSMPELKMGRNILYSLPTSGGKTLIAEILMIRTCQLLKKKSLFILPYVSICEEKCSSMELISDQLNFFVEGYFASKGKIPVDPGNQLIICTIEKANLILDNLIQEERIHELGCVVVDELHMIGEGNRGQLLEQLISKVLFIQREKKTVEIIIDDELENTTQTKIENISIQIVGMSATIPNLDQLAQWMDAILFKSDYRPVPLKEYYCIGEAVYDKEAVNTRTLTPLPSDMGKGKNDPEFITSLCCEVIPAKSVLIFCPTKQSCEDCVKHLTSTLPISNDFVEEKIELVSNLKLIGTDDTNLLNGIMYGVVYHHSSLTSEERQLIENAYRNHIICVICCTSTLAAGINLPAARVIFNTPYIGFKQFLTKSKYMQMSGRSGRAGIDSFGESYLVLQKQFKSQVDGGKDLISKKLENVNSCINLSDSDSLSRICIEIISSKLISSMDQIEKFVDCTYYKYQNQDMKFKLVEKMNEVSRQLIANNLLQVSSQQQEQEGSSCSKFEMTSLGMGTSRSTLTLKESLALTVLLQTVQDEGIIISDDLHILYVIGVPIDGNGLIEPNYVKLLNYLEQCATPIEKKIIARIGLPENAILTKAMNKYSKISDEDQTIVKRVYNAFILRDLINERTNFIDYCEIKGRGMIQQLMSQACTFCSMVHQFCETLDYWQISKIAKKYIRRIQYGVKSDIVDLVQLEGVKRPEIARILKQGDFTIEKLSKVISECEDQEFEIPSLHHQDYDEEHDNPLLILIHQRLMLTLLDVGNNNYTVDQRSFIQNYFTTKRVGAIVYSAKRELSKKAFYLRQRADTLDC